MNNTTLYTIVSIVFILLGAYNVFGAARHARMAKVRGERYKWIQDLSALIGFEYLLLAWVFLLSNLLSSGKVSPSMKNFLIPLLLLVLVAAAIFAGLVMRRGIMNSRILRAQMKSKAAKIQSNGAANGAPQFLKTSANPDANGSTMKQDKSITLDRRRERRKNAAVARRRRAGRA